MVDYMNKISCEKHVNCTVKNSYGDAWPYKGALPYIDNGKIDWVLPDVHKDFKIINVPTWGYRLINKQPTN